MNDKIVELESVQSLLNEEMKLRNQAENDCAEAKAALPEAEAAVVEREKALQHVRGLLLKTHEERTYYRNMSEAKGQTLFVVEASHSTEKPPPPESTNRWCRYAGLCQSLAGTRCLCQSWNLSRCSTECGVRCPT